MSSVLYITYDGLLEPLGQSQVLAYLAQLAAKHDIHVLSFEKAVDRRNAAAMQAMRARVRALGIGWTPLAYHKTPSALATAFDIALGMAMGTYIALRKRVKIVHARSYVPALIALPIRTISSSRFIFDMRGLWADERVDGNLWPRDGTLYRITKKLEDLFLRTADHVVTLTRASADELGRFPVYRTHSKPISVIPTCADLTRFCPSPGKKEGDFTFGYIGSVGTWYMFQETLAFFRALLVRRPNARFLIVNRNEHDLIRTMVNQAGLSHDRIELVAAAHQEVPLLVQRMHLGAALIRPSYSKIASAPTKIAEYLGCGVPCLGNAGIGDVAETLEGKNVGIVMRAFASEDFDVALEKALQLCDDESLGRRCADAANELFSLERGVASYEHIYQSLAS